MFIPNASIDTLYDYTKLFDKGTWARLPQKALGQEVAVIGSGAAGMLAAYELLRMGLKPIIYEARDRMGGRLYSKSFESIQNDAKPFAELGAMRIPQASWIFFNYAKKLGLTTSDNFPNPGQINTSIHYKDQLYHWKMGHHLPEPFYQTQRLWNVFVDPLVTNIHQEWKKGNLDRVQQLWQIHIDQFKDMSLYQALIERSPIKTSESMNIMATIGFGRGGFSSLFEISFLEILRLLVNGYIAEDLIINEGISEFINRLYHLKVKTPCGLLSLADQRSIHLNLPVVLFDYNPKTNNPILITKNQEQVFDKKEYPAIIFTGSLCAAQLLNITNKTESGVYLLDPAVRQALKNSPMIASSKTYICTETKFWRHKHLPRCILSDDLTRATYFIDYPATDYGIVDQQIHSIIFVFDKMVLVNDDPSSSDIIDPYNECWY